MSTTKTTKPGQAKTTTAADKLLELVRLEPPKTREELMELCTTTTRLTIQRDEAQLKLEKRILDLQESQGPMIEALKVEIDRSVKLLHLWSVANRDVEFDGRQGISVSGCTLEFRKGTGKVVADKDDKTTLDNLLALPKGFEEEQKALVRPKCELNKQAALTMAKSEAGAAFLKKMGLQVVVEEEFKFTPARGDLTPLPVSGGSTPLKDESAKYVA